MLIKVLIINFLSCLIGIGVFAAPLIPEENCFITTTTEYKDGDIRSKTNSFYFKTKAECLKSKKLLSENFNPQKIKKVAAKLEWRGK